MVNISGIPDCWSHCSCYIFILDSCDFIRWILKGIGWFVIYFAVVGFYHNWPMYSCITVRVFILRCFEISMPVILQSTPPQFFSPSPPLSPWRCAPSAPSNYIHRKHSSNAFHHEIWIEVLWNSDWVSNYMGPWHDFPYHLRICGWPLRVYTQKG